jgi:hypothetical protein
MSQDEHVTKFFDAMRESGRVPADFADELEAGARQQLSATKHTMMIAVPRELLADCPPLDLDALLSGRLKAPVPAAYRWREVIGQYRQFAGHLAYRLIAGHWPEDYYGNED